jgi:hypothetical protein
MWWRSAGPHSSQTVSPSTSINTSRTDITANVGFGSYAAGIQSTEVNGLLFTSTTTGNIYLRWAQTTSEASNTIRRAGSYLVLRRLA